MGNYKQTCDALAIGIMANVPTLLWGPPGQGKTSVLNKIAEDYEMHMETIIASVREPSDFAGLPIVDAATGSVALAPPNWALRLKDRGKGIAFYDEISTAAPATQAALLRPILDNCVGDCQMPAEIRTVGAANPADIAAGGWDLAPPMANRFLHLQWTLSADIVREGFSVGWPTIELPHPDDADVRRLTAESKILVGTFLGSRPELLTKMPDSSEQGNLAFPTPRSWEQAAKLYGYALACGADTEVIQMLLNGSVGTSATGEFITFVANLDLPDPEVLLRNPDSLVVPSDRGDKVYAILASVYAALSNNPTPERWINAGQIIGKIADAGHGDIAFTFGRRWAKARPDGAMPKPETVKSLGPILSELGKLVTTR